MWQMTQVVNVLVQVLVTNYVVRNTEHNTQGQCVLLNGHM